MSAIYVMGKTLLVFLLSDNVGPMSANTRRIDICSWRWADVDKMTVGFLTLSQRWPNVGKYTEDRRL